MDRIRQLRKDRGLSQAKLAVMADMDPATLNRLERGTGNPNLKTLERVADALEVGVADLLPKALRRSSLEPTFNDVLEDERREHRRAAAAQYAIEDIRLTVDRYERYQTMSEKLDEFRKGWEARLETEDFDQAALEEAGRTASAFWPMVTALADFELGDLMRAGSQLEEAAAQSALAPAIKRYQALCDRVNAIYRERYHREETPWPPLRVAS